MKAKKKKTNHSVILVTWIETGVKEIYSGITCFLDYHPKGHNRRTIYSYLVRGSAIYMTPELTIEKLPLIGRKRKA